MVEITRVERFRFMDVPWEFAVAEGEGFTRIDDWRRGHRAYYKSQGSPVRDEDEMVCVWIRVVEPEG